MKPTKRMVVAALSATTLMPLIVFAAGQDTKYQGYVVNGNGGGLVRSGTGLCWRDSDWTQARSVEPCDLTSRHAAAALPAPVPLVMAAVPPVPAAPPAAILPLPEEIGFSGDAFFDFDKSDLTPEGKSMLDDLVLKLAGASVDTIVITGHTDRIGSTEYNQKLSEHRAQTVKKYLVSRNVQADRIDAVGRGKTRPVTKADDCRGAISAGVIACLQPDRRVDVELTGARTITGSR